jgi:NAD+ kinase
VATVLFVLHHERPEAVALVQEAAAWLVEAGHQVRLPAADAAHAGLERHACDDDALVKDLDLAVSLGGDGTMLRTVDLAADSVPVLGVNFGTLGYLTEVEPAALIRSLQRFFEGDFVVEERMRMVVEVNAASCAGHYPALNEAVLGKTPTGQIVRIAVLVDGEYFTTYHADGLIIATPTGSTAYAWSAGGPIISPVAEALLLTPVAPHMLFDRSMVLPRDTCVRLEVVADRSASLSVDGRNLGLLVAGDTVVCTASPTPARLVTFGTRNFLGILKAKFGLNDRWS